MLNGNEETNEIKSNGSKEKTYGRRTERNQPQIVF